MKKRLLPLIAIGLFASSLAGCSSKDESKLMIGLECAYAPFNWAETSENSYTLPVKNHRGLYADGYDIQIAKYLSRELNMEVEIYETVWESLISDLQTGALNLIVAGMTDNEERRQSIDFTSEYYRSELVLITQKSVADLYEGQVLTTSQFADFINGQIVVSQNSTMTNDIIDIFESDYGAIHATPVATFASAATDVNNGSAFAMTAEKPVAESLTASFTNLGVVRIAQEILGEAQAELGVSIGLRKDSTLKDRINDALSRLSQDEREAMMLGAIERSA